MANKNSEYWQQRFGQLENASHQEAMTVYSRIEESFYQAQREIENKINSLLVFNLKTSNKEYEKKKT